MTKHILDELDDALGRLLRAPGNAVGAVVTRRSTERQPAGSREPAPEKAKLPPGRPSVRLPSRADLKAAGIPPPNPYSGK